MKVFCENKNHSVDEATIWLYYMPRLYSKNTMNLHKNDRLVGIPTIILKNTMNLIKNDRLVGIPTIGVKFVVFKYNIGMYIN